MLRENIERVKNRVSLACLRAGRDVLSVEIIVVTKGRSLEDIKEAVHCGLSAIGENRVQEALLKYAKKDFCARWHMIGHLQKNKVKDAIGIFDLIQSVNSLKLCEEINVQAARIGKVQDVFLEIKTSPEDSKSGFLPGDTLESLRIIAGLANLKVLGLMTIPPWSSSGPEGSRAYFKRLFSLREEIRASGILNRELKLSMGMSDDFEVAIEEGADMVRIGRAIFEGGRYA